MQHAWTWNPAYATRQTVDGPLNLSVSAYGYGLGIMQDCRFATIVQHGGGLPGYGSIERWLPDYGVGLIAFGNLTYASFTALIDEAFSAMLATGALQRRVVQPSPKLLQAQRDVSSLIMHWDDALADRIAAGNLFLDESQTDRKDDLARFAVAHGACRAATAIDAENALRGTWEMPCERGALRVRITLAPTMPPKVQLIDIRSILPATDETRQAIVSKLSTIPPEWGKCAIGASVSASAMQVSCDRGKLTARVSDGDVTFEPLRDADHRCVP